MSEYHDMDQIDENLWLGNLSSACDIKSLKEKGIKKILSVFGGKVPIHKKEDGFIQLSFKIADHYTFNIIQFFGECLNFIKGEEKILVHCLAGASRSATIVIAYLMWNKKMKYEDAIKLVSDKRKGADPNIGFKEQLKMFEKLLIENGYNIDKINFKEIVWEPKEIVSPFQSKLDYIKKLFG